MRILILGAGQVGASVAEALASEANDITVIDQNRESLAQIADHLDVRTLAGNAAYPSTLREAGIEDTDLLVAVTQSDQTNLVACKIARSMFNVPTRIARLRSPDFLDDALLSDENFSVDYAICPEQEITEYIGKLIEFPEALQVLEFAGGRVTLVGVRAFQGGQLVGKPIRAMREHLPESIDARIAAIFREHQPLDPDGHTVIEPGDEVFVLAASEHIRPVMRELRRMQQPVKRVMIAGGGNIGMRLAETIESRYAVKVIEMHPERCKLLSERLQHGIALRGSASDRELLIAENVEDTDVFCALTNDDEINIMSSLLAKRLGAAKVITLIGNPAYVDLVQGVDIDIAISPQQVTIGSLLTHVRRGHMTNVYRLRRGAAEALEIVAHGDSSNSKVVGKALGDIKLPEGVTIGAIVRGSEVLIAHRHVKVQTDDHVIMFLVDKSRTREVEKLFQVGFGFF